MYCKLQESYIGLGKSDPIDALLLQTMQELETLNPSLGVAASFWLWNVSHGIAFTLLNAWQERNLSCFQSLSEIQWIADAWRRRSAFLRYIWCYIFQCINGILSPEEILDSSEEDLIAFLAKKSRNRIKDISKTADLLKKAARDSYRLDKALYEPLNVSIASSFNCIETFKREIKVIDNAIEKK